MRTPYTIPMPLCALGLSEFRFLLNIHQFLNFHIFSFYEGIFRLLFFGPWARALLRQYFRNIIKNCFQTKRNLKPFARTGQPCRPVCNYNATVLSTWENCSGPNRSSMKRRVRSHFGSTDALHFQAGRSDCLVLINGKRLK